MAAHKQSDKPDILFISGSPRARTCEALVGLLEQGAKKAGAKTQRFCLSKKRIHPCIGCGACEKTGICSLASRTHDKQFLDDYLELKAVLERVDAVALVAPLYFAGPPAQLKALLDRMQPYWAQRYRLGIKPPAKRPAQLFVVGGGGDEHGYTPLSITTKSAIAVAGFTLEKVNNFIGFAAPRDAPIYPPDSEAQSLSHAQLAKLKRAVSEQAAFTQRALDAGSAFARYVVKKKEAAILTAQLAQVEAELAVLNEVGDARHGDARQGDVRHGDAEGRSALSTEGRSAEGRSGEGRGAEGRSSAEGRGGTENRGANRTESRSAVRTEHQAEIDLDYSKLIISVDKGDE
ncbi:MAG: flavodoxin family protein [Coriobacteriales bacterium]|jgi:multimeric flavodoxin WrbA|nr:flavodoxin family protein [Coriobacteriales bacterium]